MRLRGLGWPCPRRSQGERACISAVRGALTRHDGGRGLVSATGAARAGDDGAAPLWVGLGSIVSPLIGFNLGKGEKPRRSNIASTAKSSCRKSMDLPPPGASVRPRGPWPVNQETQRKKAREGRRQEGDCRRRRCAPALYASLPQRARHGPRIGSVRRSRGCPTASADAAQSSSVLGKPESIGLGRDRQVVEVGSRAGPRMADRSAEGLSRPGGGRSQAATAAGAERRPIEIVREAASRRNRCDIADSALGGQTKNRYLYRRIAVNRLGRAARRMGQRGAVREIGPLA